jgi:hypothetical protein
MSKILEDLINAGRGRPCGIFEGDPLAAEYSRRMTRNEKKRILHGGRICIKACECLKEYGMIREIPQRSITEGELLDLLWSNIGNGKRGNDAAEYVYKEIVKGEYPPRRRPYKKVPRIQKKQEN